MASAPLTLDTPVVGMVSLSSEANDYIRQFSLISHVELAVTLAGRHFEPIEPILVELEVDPETDEKRIALNVAIRATVDVAMKSYDAYLREWAATAPIDAQLHIGLIYDIRDAG